MEPNILRVWFYSQDGRAMLRVNGPGGFDTFDITPHAPASAQALPTLYLVDVDMDQLAHLPIARRSATIIGYNRDTPVDRWDRVLAKCMNWSCRVLSWRWSLRLAWRR